MVGQPAEDQSVTSLFIAHVNAPCARRVRQRCQSLKQKRATTKCLSHVCSLTA